MRSKWITGILFVCLLLTAQTPLALAHQPVCEFADLTASAPWQVPDATISYAYFGNVHPAGDIDYYRFQARAGQSVLLSLSIPAIEGIEVFSPLLAITGPGIPADGQLDLPTDLRIQPGQGAAMVSLGENPRYWFEPFGRKYFWNWDDSYFTAPQTAEYTVALWHPSNEIGRYSFVIGQREVFAGADMDCFATYGQYWTPLSETVSPYRDAPDISQEAHDLANLLEVPADGAPEVRIQLFPLSNGAYLLRVKTSNFEFAPHLADQAAALNQGHAHLYLDGEKISRIYGKWHQIARLPDDWQQLTVALNANDHRVFGVDGNAIADSIWRADLSGDTG